VQACAAKLRSQIGTTS